MARRSSEKKLVEAYVEGLSQRIRLFCGLPYRQVGRKEKFGFPFSSHLKPTSWANEMPSRGFNISPHKAGANRAKGAQQHFCIHAMQLITFL